jgi:sRNA-binding protein
MAVARSRASAAGVAKQAKQTAALSDWRGSGIKRAAARAQRVGTANAGMARNRENIGENLEKVMAGNENMSATVAAVRKCDNVKAGIEMYLEELAGWLSCQLKYRQ